MWDSAEGRPQSERPKEIENSLAACAWAVSELQSALMRFSPAVAVAWNVMASSSDSDDDSFMAVDQEEAVLGGTMEPDEEPRAALEVGETRHNRSMSELPEEVLEYILSFLSPYQEHKTAALVCKQWYRLIKGTVGRGGSVCSFKVSLNDLISQFHFLFSPSHLLWF